MHSPGQPMQHFTWLLLNVMNTQRRISQQIAHSRHKACCNCWSTLIIPSQKLKIFAASLGLKLNDFTRRLFHLGANLDQQRNKTEWIWKKFHRSRRKFSHAAGQHWMNSKEVSSVSAQTQPAARATLNEFKRSVFSLGANSNQQSEQPWTNLKEVSSLSAQIPTSSSSNPERI